MNKTLNDSSLAYEKKDAELKWDIGERYTKEGEDFRFQLLNTYQVLDIQLQALGIMWEGIRAAGVVATGAKGKNSTVIIVKDREEYDDGTRRLRTVTGFTAVMEQMRRFVRKVHREDREVLEPQINKVSMLMDSLKNVRYRVDGSGDDVQKFLPLTGESAAFARRIGLTPKEEKILRYYGSVRLEEVLRVCESRFSDFSRRENTLPNMGPDRPFFIKPMWFSLEHEVLSIWKDLEEMLPYPIPVPVRKVEIISTGNVRKLNDFSGRVEMEAHKIFASLFHSYAINEFLTKQEDFKTITRVFLEKVPCMEAIMLGLGFSPGFKELIGVEEYYMNRVLAPLMQGSEELAVYFLTGLLLGYDRVKDRTAVDLHPIIARLMEFPLAKGAHFLGVCGETLGVVVQ